MIIDVDIEVKEVEELLDRLDTCFSPAGMAQFMRRDVAPYLRSRAAKRFSGGGDDASGAWVPLAHSTTLRRARGIASGEYSGIGPDSPINVRHGEMRDYIAYAPGEITTGDDVTLHFPKRGAHAGNMRYKIGTAQRGAGGRTPARPVLAVSQTDANNIALDMTSYIVRSILRS